LVQPTLQIANGKGAEARAFALGDVAETDGPKMARAAWYQAEIVRQNILALIRGQKPSSTYVPNLEVEGSLKLTLGKVSNVTPMPRSYIRDESLIQYTQADWIIYVKPEKGDAMITKGDNGKEDLEVHGAWAYWGSDIKQAIRPE
jgi:apoptosis-inducing factor 2